MPEMGGLGLRSPRLHVQTKGSPSPTVWDRGRRVETFPLLHHLPAPEMGAFLTGGLVSLEWALGCPAGLTSRKSAESWQSFRSGLFTNLPGEEKEHC